MIKDELIRKKDMLAILSQCDSVTDVYKAIYSMPSAEKTGRWIYQDDRREVTGNDWYCSECGNGVRYRDHYCPSCGANMGVEYD